MAEITLSPAVFRLTSYVSLNLCQHCLNWFDDLRGRQSLIAFFKFCIAFSVTNVGVFIVRMPAHEFRFYTIPTHERNVNKHDAVTATLILVDLSTIENMYTTRFLFLSLFWMCDCGNAVVNTIIYIILFAYRTKTNLHIYRYRMLYE